MPSEVLGVAPWVIIAALVAWYGAIAARNDRKKKDADDQSDRLEMHRDGLTLQIIRAGREELQLAKVESDALRVEVKKLRQMEEHFYHFQQSLDHLEALLTASTDEAKRIAERNAQAFLTRMRRLAEAKGTLANEAQRVVSEISLLGEIDKRTQPKNITEGNGNVSDPSAA